MSQDLSFIKYMKWSTDAPVRKHGESTESSAFYVEGNEYYFRFAFKEPVYPNKGSNYFLFFLLKKKHVKFQPFTYCIRVDIDGKNIWEKKEFEMLQQPCCQSIWFISSSKLKPGDKLTFLFSLDDKMLSANKLQDECQESKNESDAGIDVHIQALSRDLSNLLDQSTSCDVKITCEGQVFNAHRLILSMRSPVFSAMFQNDMIEAKTGEIKVEDFNPSIFQSFLRYLYSGTLPEMNMDTAKVFYEIADKYAVKELKQACSDFLTKNLTKNSACEILVLADLHSDDDFRKAIILYIVDQKIPANDKCWTDFSKNYPILAVEVLNLYIQKHKLL